MVTPASAMPQGTIRSNHAEVVVAVEREAVHRHAAATRTPIAATLRSGRASSARTRRRCGRGPRAVATPKSAQTRDQRLLEAADVVDDVDVLGQPDDRVADELAGAVERDLAAAVDVDDRRAAVDGPLPRLGALAGGVDRRVLEQQHRVGLSPATTRGVEPRWVSHASR